MVGWSAGTLQLYILPLEFSSVSHIASHSAVSSYQQLYCHYFYNPLSATIQEDISEVQQTGWIPACVFTNCHSWKCSTCHCFPPNTSPHCYEHTFSYSSDLFHCEVLTLAESCCCPEVFYLACVCLCSHRTYAV